MTAATDFQKPRPQRGRKAAERDDTHGVPLSEVSHFAREYVRECRWRKLSPRTEEMRESITSKFLFWAETIAQLPLSHLVTRADSEAFFLYMQEGHKTKEGRWHDPLRGTKPMSDRAYANYFAWLKAFWKWCEGRDFIQEMDNPMRGMASPRCPKPKIAPLPLSDIPRLIQAAVRQSMFPLRDEALLLLLLDTGIRVSELCDLTIGDIDLTTGKATIRHGKGGKARLVVFSPQTSSTLRRYVRDALGARPDPRCPVFVSVRDIQAGEEMPRGLTDSGVRQVLTRLKEAAGIPSGQRVSPHMFRRTFATTMLDKGSDMLSVQTLLGHESPVMTMRYATYNDEQITQKHRQFSPVEALTEENTRGRKRAR